MQNSRPKLWLVTCAILLAATALYACGNDSGGGSNAAPISPSLASTTAPPPLGSPGPLKSIGIDYTPEARCSDNNWSNATPAACNPQLSFSCTNPTLSLCPTSCQSCYVSDLTNLKSSLNVSTITVYQPNYYILTAANQLHLKVMQGLFNDAIPSLAKPSTSTDCFYAGTSIALCGSKYADAILNGACGSTTPWNPATFCSSGAYVEPLAPFVKDGTIIAIQLGNEALGTTVDNQQITTSMISAAAKTLRKALHANGFTSTPIVVSLVLGQEKTFCSGGAPPAGVDYVAAHPYCNYVASVPPQWPNDGKQCWSQVQNLFKNISEKYCGASHTFIGETGYNTGCPNSSTVPSTTLSDEQTFIKDLKKSTCSTPSASGFPTFLFAYSDVCPSTGCAPGCSDAGMPDEGNGYFGIFHTKDYLTEGTPVPKFTPVPSMACP